MLSHLSAKLVLVSLLLVAIVLTGMHEGVRAGAFPGLNGKIAFASARDQTLDIYTVGATGGDLERLTRDPLSSDIDPSWSRDGTRIAFTSNRSGNDDIYVMGADGTGQTRLTTDPFSDVNPSWSPGGRNIAFASTRDGDSEIFVMNEDGTGQAQLTRNEGAADAVPAWSPDGARVAFTSTRDGNAEIYVMNVDGAAQTRLTAASGNDVSPSWSPDGRNIAFASDRDGNYEIYVMSADGSGPTRLTRNLEVDLDPAWSPDGTAITFTTNRDGNYEIYAMQADGSAQTRLTAAPGDDTTADWQAVAAVPMVVDSARFVGSWQESTYVGMLEIAGDAPGPARFRVTLRRGTRTYLSSLVTTATGVFSRQLGLPRTLLPGDYTLDITPVESPTVIGSQRSRPVLRAPPEGVVSRTWASATVGGPPMEKVPATKSIAFAHFRFASLPRVGRSLTTRWYVDGRKVGENRKPRGSLVIAWVEVKGAPLPRGRYTCVLRAGGTVVERLSFRVS